MHDVQLEDRLRRALQSEADSLPFTLTADVLETRLGVRGRAAWNQRLAFLAAAAAALAVVAVGVGAFLLNRDTDESVTVSPSGPPVVSPSVVPSGSPQPSESTSPEPSFELPPSPTPRPSFAGLGASNDAVMVTYVGDPLHPDRIDVSLMTIDAGAFETSFEPRLLVSLPGAATFAANYEFDVRAPRYSPDGWLAVGVTDTDSGDHALMIYDLQSGSPTELMQGDVGAAAWNGGSVLAIVEGSTVRLYDARTRSVSTVNVPADVFLGEGGTDPNVDTPQWLADGTGFIGRFGAELPYTYGVLSLDGTFSETQLQPQILQSTGTERRWGEDWSEAATGCPTEGGPPGCSVWTDIGGGPTTTWYEEDDGLGRILEVEWDASGHGLWLTVDRSGDGASVKEIAIMHASEPRKWRDVVSFSMELAADDIAGLAGLRDAEPTADAQLFLFRVPFGSGPLRMAAAGHDVHAEFEGPAWFVGWAGAQPPYPGLIGP